MKKPNAPSWKPYGLALLDYWKGDKDATFSAYTLDGVETPLPAALFFREGEDISVGDEYALSLCEGRVLDIGAGAGVMALPLQEMGFEVTALDISPEAVEVLKGRGVRDARVGDFFDFEGDRYDTLLMAMNGVGFVGSLEGFDRMLDHAEKLLLPGGQIILDSSDLDQNEFGEELRAPEGSYKGAIWYQMAYGEAIGEPYTWLYVDPASLCARAEAKGWLFQEIFDGPEGYFIARLMPGEYTV